MLCHKLPLSTLGCKEIQLSLISFHSFTTCINGYITKTNNKLHQNSKKDHHKKFLMNKFRKNNFGQARFSHFTKEFRMILEKFPTTIGTIIIIIIIIITMFTAGLLVFSNNYLQCTRCAKINNALLIGHDKLYSGPI